jgi:hypothetical protein
MTPETQLLPPVQRQDGALLHFLKELPGWVVVSAALIFFTAIYMMRADDFIPRIIDALIGAFLGLVVSQRPKAPTNIKTETVTTDSVTTDSIDNSTVNTENLTVKEK